MVKKNTSFMKLQLDDPVYTNFDSNFIWDSEGYSYTHQKTLIECQKMCDDSLARSTLRKKERLTTVQKTLETSSHWTDQQLKDIEEEKKNNAFMLEQHHQSKVEWAERLEKIQSQHSYVA
jgi:hypothetical protein